MRVREVRRAHPLLEQSRLSVPQPSRGQIIAAVELRREIVHGEFLDARRDFEQAATEVEVRWDPLTGHVARIVHSPTPLLPSLDLDLDALAVETREQCIFCPERVELVTPRLPDVIHSEGRLRRGEALLFPNIVAYAKHAAVAVYSPQRHYVRLEQMTPRLIIDALSVQVEFITAVMRYDPASRWASINANHMLPSGGSVFHPHLQTTVDPYPSTMQEQLAAVSGERFTDYLETERRLGERYIGATGVVEWCASFAPIGFNELRAFMPGSASPAELEPGRLADLGEGIARALHLYANLGQQSFNLAIYGAPPGTEGYMLNARLVCRSNPRRLYRSDAMYSERLHWQAMVDTVPEELAQTARQWFAA
jgi:UDPglucose--hexose-1-phosphate uridylyltransferase